MKRFLTAALVMSLAASALGAEPSVQRRTQRADMTRKVAPDSTRAAEALFLHSSIDDAKRFASAALKRDATNAQALFVRMEAAALEGDVANELDSAVRLCTGANSETEYAEIAAGRIREMAANTAEFRRIIPRLRSLIANSARGNDVRLAMVSAASDGAPEFNLLQQSRESGLLTDWRFLGPFGRVPNLDFDKKMAPESDGLKKNIYNGKRVEYVQFVDGRFSLPSYARKRGVFYASSRISLRSGGDWLLRVESPGTMQVFLDGDPIMTRDDRRESKPEVIVQSMHISGGEHTVMVKFVSEAAPFRIAIMAPTGVLRRKNKPMLHAGPEAEYVSASLHYYRQDATTAVRALTEVAAKTNSAPVQFALAHAWARIAGEEEAPERANALRAASNLAPAAAAVEEELAVREDALDHTDDALQHLKRALSQNAESERGLELLSRVAVRYGWKDEANTALETLIRLHPSCQNLNDAVNHYSRIGETVRVAQLEPRLEQCAPGALTYANWLAANGRHGDAARAAADAVRYNAYDRDARTLQLRELVLAGNTEPANSLATELAQLAPGCERCVRAAENPAELLNARADSSSPDDAEFYRAFRRDGLKLVSDAAPRKYSGGPAVTLLEDKVARLGVDGSGAVYVHRITRVLNRDGIEQYGEASIPAGAHILELRTIKTDLTVVEPEFNQHKATISMPALAPGDAIEQEYVQYFAENDALAQHAEAYAFEFGSFRAPILFSKFVLIAPKETAIVKLNTSPEEKTVALDSGSIARVWERDDIPQSTREIAMPQMALLPQVKVQPPQEDTSMLSAIAADAALDATRPGARTMALASKLTRTDDEQTAREMYRIVTSSVRNDSSSFATGDVTTAEASFGSGEGSRAATLMALASAAGLRADLVLARPTTAATDAYTHPLVVFHFGERIVAADPDTDGMPFGSIAPTLERSAALVVPLEMNANLAEVARVELPKATTEESSIARGTLDFDEEGTFHADVSITMGAYRGAQMRDILRGIAPADRSQFFEQLALRLFPGAVDATGSVLNENDAEQSLVLLMKCRSPHFLDLSAQSLDMDQLVPALGLRRMYTTLTWRKFPLYVDALLFETATFRVHLPPGVSIARNAPDFRAKNEFGSYAVTFQQRSDSEVEITREFNVPVQLVEPTRYPAFAQFANSIDEAERQRLTLKVEPRTMAQAGN